MTQLDLSKLSKINVMAISHFECDRREPRVKNLIRLCDVLGLTMDWFCRGIRKCS